MTTGASAQRMDRDGGMMTMDRAEVRSQRMESMETRTVREPRTTGTVTMDRGASAYAPGQVKKRTPVARSARDLAPGRSDRIPPGQMMQEDSKHPRSRPLTLKDSGSGAFGLRFFLGYTQTPRDPPPASSSAVRFSCALAHLAQS
jgi:hypothetical protein